MTTAIILIVLAVIIAAELIWCIVGSVKASDFTYYLCRPFGIEMSMRAGTIVRTLLIIGATICCVLGTQMLM